MAQTAFAMSSSMYLQGEAVSGSAAVARGRSPPQMGSLSLASSVSLGQNSGRH